MRKIRKIISLLFLSFFLLSLINTPTIEAINRKNAILYPDASADQTPTGATVCFIQVTSVENMYRHDMIVQYGCDVGNVITAALYRFQIHEETLAFTHVLTPQGGAATYFTGETYTPINPPFTELHEQAATNHRYMDFPFYFISQNFLSPDGANNAYAAHATGMTVSWGHSTLDGTFTNINTLAVTIHYDLQVRLDITSILNNLGNVRVYTRTDVSTTYREQDPYNIRIDSYK